MAMNKDTAKIIPFGASARACERARHESTKDAILLLEGVKTAEFGGGWYHEYGHLHKWLIAICSNAAWPPPKGHCGVLSIVGRQLGRRTTSDQDRVKDRNPDEPYPFRTSSPTVRIPRAN
jgi:hypothetical protein